MKETKILYLDFDEKYKGENPGEDIIVLSGSYENAWAIDVRKKRSFLADNVKNYTAEWKKILNETAPIYRDTLIANEASFFRTVISPLSRWMEAIDFIFLNFKISEVILTSTSENSKIFTYEAEGETNMALLYKKSYYLPYYLSQYINNKYNVVSKSEKAISLLVVKIKFFLRNASLFGYFIFKTFLFAALVNSRKIGSSKSNSKIKYIISSRAVVQSEFVERFYHKHRNESILIANEQSFRLSQHVKFLKKTNKTFIYAEGALKIRDIWKILCNYFQKLKISKTHGRHYIRYNGVDINLNSFIIDLVTRELDYYFYATSVKNTIHKFKLGNKDTTIISFEMFTPYAYYLREATKLKTVQIQSTFIEPVANPNFIISDHFYFTNSYTYTSFKNKNILFEKKMGCIPFMKYVDSSRKILNEEIHKIVYFTQPIDQVEEDYIIEFLEKYCEERKIIFLIKPHPRQRSLFNNLKYATIADKRADLPEVLLNCDVAITRSSTVGLDAWVYGVPCVFVKLNTVVQAQDLFYAPSNYSGCVCTLDQLRMALGNYKKLITDFTTHQLYKETDMNSLDNNQKEGVTSLENLFH